MKLFARILLAIISITLLYLLIEGNLAPLLNLALLVAFILSQEALNELERED